MQKIPLIMAASHTLMRRFMNGCVNFIQFLGQMVRGGLMFALGICLIIGGMVSSLMLFVMPLMLSLCMLDPDAPIHLFARHEGIFFHSGHPTALSWGIYLALVILAYAAGLAHAIRSGVVADEQAKAGPSRQLEALLCAPLQVAGRAYMGFMNQIFAGKLGGWDGMLAAPVIHGWKTALCCLALPIHFLALLAMLFKPAFQSLGNFVPKLTKIQSFGEVLERLAHESPDILARHEAKSLDAQVNPGKEPESKKRL